MDNETVSILEIAISLVPSNETPLIFLAVSNFEALLAFPVKAPVILSAWKAVLAPFKIKPPVDTSKFPLLLDKVTEGVGSFALSVPITKDLEERNNSEKGSSLVPNEIPLFAGCIFPKTIKSFEILTFPFKFILNESVPFSWLADMNSPIFW